MLQKRVGNVVGNTCKPVITKSVDSKSRDGPDMTII